MEVKVFILPGGQVQIIVDGEGSVEEAERLTRLVLAQLEAAGTGVTPTSAIERHRAGVSHAHVTARLSENI